MNEILKFLSPYNNQKLPSVDKINWEHEINKLANHRLAALLFWKLEGTGQLKELPPAIRNKLKNTYLYTLIANTNMTKDLEALVPYFNDFNYAVVKGVHLSHCIYPDTGTRSFADIDIIVDESDRKAFKTLLKNKGYERLPCDKKYPTFNEEVFVKNTGNGMQHFLDIHCYTLHNKRFHKLNACKISSFLEETEYLKINESSVRVLSPEALIIYLNIHAVFAHFYRQISMLLDILWSYRASESNIDMEKLAFMAKKLGILKSIKITFGLIDKLFDTKISGLVDSKKNTGNKPFILNLISADKMYTMDNAPNYWRRFILQPFLFDSLGDSKHIILGSFDTLFPRFQTNKAFNFFFKNI